MSTAINEQETTINFAREDGYATIWTSDRTVMTKLDILVREAPENWRLQDDSLSDEDLEKEIKRSKAVTSVAETIVKNGQLQLQAATFRKTWYGADEEVPLLGINMKKDHK